MGLVASRTILEELGRVGEERKRRQEMAPTFTIQKNDGEDKTRRPLSP